MFAQQLQAIVCVELVSSTMSEIGLSVDNTNENNVSYIYVHVHITSGNDNQTTYKLL